MSFSSAAVSLPPFPAWRAPVLFSLLLAGLAGLVVRSVYLQSVDHDFLQNQGASRYSRQLDIPAHRGRITDRNGEPLAISTPVKWVWAFPSRVHATPDQLAQLAALLGLSRKELQQRIDADSDFVSLARQVPPDVADRVAKLGIQGVYEDPRYHRYYPSGEVVSHVLGFTDIHDTGKDGIELAQQDWLGGTLGSRRVLIDQHGDVVEDVASIRTPQEGRDVALSIDSRLQYLAFRELKAAVAANHAKAGSILILDVKSGEILALANAPAFNPNKLDGVDLFATRNRALRDAFEPGSVLKPFTIAAALEAGKVRPDTIIDTGAGTLTIGGATIHDAHFSGPLTVEQVIQKSSNVGAAKIALSLPSETMWRMFADVGFGAPPNTGFPGEVAGRLRPPHTWRPIEQATMAYGHGISVNLVQLARAYSVFATDGELKPVTLMKTSGPIAGRPVLRHETVMAMRKMLEMVVQAAGTAPAAQVVGYRVGGKTGTAHKAEGNGYSANRYIASFIGMAPMSNPQLIVAVVIDEPSGGQYYGGQVAAPVFSKVMGTALHALGVPTDAPTDVILPPVDSDAAKEDA